MTNKQYHRFDADKFSKDMMDLLGGRYISILAKGTNSTRNGVLKWVKQDIASKDGPSIAKREVISNYISREFGRKIVWSDYLLSEEDVESSSLSLAEPDNPPCEKSKSSYIDDLRQVKKEMAMLEGKIRDLELKLKEEESKKKIKNFNR